MYQYAKSFFLKVHICIIFLILLLEKYDEYPCFSYVANIIFWIFNLNVEKLIINLEMTPNENQYSPVQVEKGSYVTWITTNRSLGNRKPSKGPQIRGTNLDHVTTVETPCMFQWHRPNVQGKWGYQREGPKTQQNHQIAGVISLLRDSHLQNKGP